MDEKFLDLIHQIPTPLIVVNKKGEIHFQNQTFINELNLDLLNHHNNRFLKSFVAIDDHSILHNMLNPDVDNRNETYIIRLKYKKQLHWYECKTETLEDDPSLLLISFQNITAKKQLDSLIAIKRSVLQLITKGIEISEILKVLSVKIEEHFQRKTKCSIVLLDSERKQINEVYAPNLPNSYNDALIGITIGPNEGSCGRAMFNNTTVIVSDILTDSLWEEYKQLAVPLGIRACWSTPITVDNQVVGSFAVYHAEVTEPFGYESEVIELCAYLASLAVQQRNHEKLMVSESESKFNIIANHTSDMICILDKNGVVEYGSPSHQTVLGYRNDEYEGESVFSFLHPEDLPKTKHIFTYMVTHQVSGEIEFRYRHKNGHYLFIHAKGRPVINFDGKTTRYVFIGRDITEQKHDKHRLQESEQRYKSLFEYHPDATFSIDLNGTITHHNSALEKLFGYSHEECFRSFEPFTHPDYLKLTNHHFQKALSGEPQNYETLGVHKHGHSLYLRVTNVPIYIDGKVVGVYGIAKDITYQKKAEESLRVREEQLRSLLNSIPDFILFKDHEDRIHEGNETAINLFGFNDIHYKGKTFQELINDNKILSYLAQDCKENCNIAWEAGKPHSYENKIVHPDGTVSTYEIINSPHYDSSGQRKHMVSVGRDISERKAMENELRTTKENLESLFYHSADCITVTDLNGRLLEVNPAYEKLFGWMKKELIHKKSPAIPEELIEGYWDDLNKIKTGIEIVGLETVRKTKSGDLVDVDMTISPIRNKNGKVVLVLTIMRDISERKRTDKLIRKSEKLSVIGQLAAAVAHEVRNPLTSVRGFIQLFEQKINPQYIQVMLSELDRIDSIISEFLTLAKPQVSYMDSEDISCVMKNTLALIESQANLSNIQIKTDYIQPLPLLTCNANKIKQVFINILKNAIESMPNGGMIYITIFQNRDNLHVRIVDEGVGIPNELLEKLGEPFYSNKEKGTGLGLMVCFGIIEEHNGKIHIESEEGKGTTVDIVLPILVETKEETLEMNEV